VTRVLIVEDMSDIAAALRDHLTEEGFEARVAPDGQAAIADAVGWHPDVIILDLMLPDITGYEVLERIRAAAIDAPVVILSAKSDETAKIRGFRVGADDYVTKPFSLRELSARVVALARRAPALTAKAHQVLRFGAIEVHRAARRVLRDGAEVPLRPKEFDLLLALIDHAGETVSRSFLLHHAWEYATGVQSRTVDWHVAELRWKLGDDAGDPKLIQTVKKAGYRWVSAPDV
jgi:DNA-binding response OmpR family regulator